MNGCYRTIVADPPWDVKAGPDWGGTSSSRDLTYPTMKVAELVALPVGEFSDNVDQDAHLYLWTINAYLREAFDVAREWGFHHSATLAWCKAPIGSGLGGTWATNVEFVLFCRRPHVTRRPEVLELTIYLADRAEDNGVRRRDVDGALGTSDMAGWWLSRIETRCACPSWEQYQKIKKIVGADDRYDDLVRELNVRKGTTYKGRGERSVTSWFTWPRGRHSQKPEAFFDLVEQVSPGPYLELFARRQRLGWDTWGNEALAHVEMSA